MTWYITYSPQTEQALAAYAASSSVEPPAELSDVLPLLSKSGVNPYEWPGVKKLVLYQLNTAIAQYSSIDDTMSADVLEATRKRLQEELNAFGGTPFTIQRICELILQPLRHYRKLRKLLFALEKVLLVTQIIPKHDPTLPVVDDTLDEMQSEPYATVPELQHYADHGSVFTVASHQPSENMMEM